MVTDETRTMLSVRGDASVVVMPDQALIVGHVTAHADSKTSVVGIVNERLTAVTADLAKFGGVARSAQTSAAPLAWSATSLTTHAEQAHAKTTGENGFTGRHQATVSLNVSVRDFDLLEAVARVIAAYDNYDTHHVQWFVDEDNAGWPQVRAEAIRVALLRGRDYASALGGSVVRVEHVADAGLLNGDSMSFRGIRASGAAFGGSGEGIVLDPEPQTLTAVIEARFIATVGPLPT